MSNIVSSSTPLIYLAKAKKIGLLKIIYNEVFISEEVKKEVVDEGKRLKKLDANLVEKEINEGRIKVKKVSSLIEIPIELDKGEASTITLANLLKEGFRLREEVYLKVIKEAKRISQSS
jgi:predicted nucleic acid-binding protein